MQFCEINIYQIIFFRLIKIGNQTIEKITSIIAKARIILLPTILQYVQNVPPWNDYINMDINKIFIKVVKIY